MEEAGEVLAWGGFGGLGLELVRVGGQGGWDIWGWEVEDRGRDRDMARDTGREREI